VDNCIRTQFTKHPVGLTPPAQIVVAVAHSEHAGARALQSLGDMCPQEASSPGDDYRLPRDPHSNSRYETSQTSSRMCQIIFRPTRTEMGGKQLWLIDDRYLEVVFFA